MIIATAGHVDHGKTSLVKALTGTDTDQLPEERARGMSIDLGFAYHQIDASTRVAFIDVPGHERFIRNMLAGVAAIDLALLVVAADDGPMPQTLEHLAILGLLGVPQLVVALTKCDRVTPARQAQAAHQVQALLEGTAFAGAALFALATPSGAGLPALRQHLADVAAAAAAAARLQQPAPGHQSGHQAGHQPGHFRLAIDRSFVVDGAGRVVTGAVLSGQVLVGDAVRLLPQGQVLRVRGLQVLGQAADQACRGQRCAVNLAGADLKRAAPARGGWLVAEALAHTSDRLDVQLQWLPDSTPLPGPRAALLLHLGAAAVAARLAWPDGLAPQHGASGPARLLLAQPVSAAWGDRFILRDAAANRSLAGGWVVDAAGPVRGWSLPLRQTQLAALAAADTAQALQALLAISPDGVNLAQFALSRNLRPDALQALQQAMALQLVACEAGPLGLLPSQWSAWMARVLQAVDHWHAQHPDALGPDAPALHQQLGLVGAALASARSVLRACLAAAVANGTLQRCGLRHHRPGHQPLLAEADAALLGRITALLLPAGLRPPIVGELATLLGLPLAGLQADLARLAHKGLLVRVAPNRFYLPDTVAQLAAEARALAAESTDQACDAAAYRDRTGIGRNLTVQVLEFLDREGITRFDGQRHRLRG